MLVEHAHVYGIAEYYDVIGLKAFAVEKFKAAAKNFQVEHFVEVVEAIHHTTLSADKVLRAELSAVTVDHLDILLNDGEFIDALVNRSSLQAYTMDLLRAAAKRQQCLSEKLSKEDTTRKERSILEEELKLKKSVLERAVKLTNEVPACKHCSEPFAAKLEKVVQLCRSYN